MNAHRFLINHKSIREWAYFVKGDPKRKLKSDLSWGLGGALLFFAIVGIAYDLRILLWAFAVLFFFAVTWHAIALGDKGNSGSLIVKCDSGVFQSRYGQSKVLAGSINEVIFVFTKKTRSRCFS